MSSPAVFSASDRDLVSAIKSVRSCLAAMPEARMYSAAFVLALMARTGKVTWWRRWTDPVPLAMTAGGSLRSDVEDALWSAFGFPSDSVLTPSNKVRSQLGEPVRVLLEVLFKPKEPEWLTVVREGTPKAKNSVGVNLNDAAWHWGEDEKLDLRGPVEYQIGNTFRQQNGIFCSLTAADAAATHHPKETYARTRTSCPQHSFGNVCSLNGEDCASDGAGGTRIPKPRVFVHERVGREGRILTPNAFDELIERATTDKQSGEQARLPKAQDLAVITGWAAAGSGNSLNYGRLVELVGLPLLPVLTEP